MAIETYFAYKIQPLYTKSVETIRMEDKQETMAKPFLVSLLLILSHTISSFYWHMGTKWWQGANFLSQNQRLNLLYHEGETWAKCRPNTKYLIDTFFL